MCEYCENENAITNIMQTKNYFASFCTRIKNNVAKTTTIIQTSTEIIPDIHFENKINYCPMCGRKLTEEQDEKD